MSFKTIPFISVFMVLSSLAPIHAADNIPMHQQQVEFVCAICKSHDGLDDDIFVIECEDRPLITHVNCMQEWLSAGHLECPTCEQPFSSEALALVLNVLVGDEIMIENVQQDEEVARQLQDELDAQANVDRQEQIMQDYMLAAQFNQEEDQVDVPEHQEVPLVQVQQPHAEHQNLECSICMDDLNNGQVRALPCMHAFHANCINLWLVDNTQCPICRMDVS